MGGSEKCCEGSGQLLSGRERAQADKRAVAIEGEEFESADVEP